MRMKALRSTTVLLVAASAAIGLAACNLSPQASEIASSGHSEWTTGMAVIGDYGTANDSEQAVASQVKRWADQNDADALVTTGDNAYPYSNPETLEAAWTPAYGWADELEVIATLGNHDVEDDGGVSTIDYFELPGPWYQETIGNVDVFVLDANQPENPEQTQWLSENLSRSDAAWKVVVFHQPAFSCSLHDSDPRVVEQWVPPLERFEVDLVLSGHEHNYQRFEAGSTTYLVTGGGGSELYELDGCPEGVPTRLAANDDAHHFLGIQVSDEEMRVQAIDTEGKILDSFSLRP
jgi:3',5'-cyclic AMP phosphodiesterase CpdA